MLLLPRRTPQCPAQRSNNTAGQYDDLRASFNTVDEVKPLAHEQAQLVKRSIENTILYEPTVAREETFVGFGTAVSMDRKRTIDVASQANNGGSSTLMSISEQAMPPPAKPTKKKKESMLKVTYGALSEKASSEKASSESVESVKKDK